MKRRSPVDLAVSYSRRVAPASHMTLVQGRCVCEQCKARRAWMAGYLAAKRQQVKTS